jgi:hypothetical protein
MEHRAPPPLLPEERELVKLAAQVAVREYLGELTKKPKAEQQPKAEPKPVRRKPKKIKT